MEEGTWKPPASGLTRALLLLVLALVVVAIVYSGWIALRYLSQIHV